MNDEVKHAFRQLIMEKMQKCENAVDSDNLDKIICEFSSSISVEEDIRNLYNSKEYTICKDSCSGAVDFKYKGYTFELGSVFCPNKDESIAERRTFDVTVCFLFLFDEEKDICERHLVHDYSYGQISTPSDVDTMIEYFIRSGSCDEAIRLIGDPLGTASKKCIHIRSKRDN